jgi:hypothetical protein
MGDGIWVKHSETMFYGIIRFDSGCCEWEWDVNKPNPTVTSFCFFCFSFLPSLPLPCYSYTVDCSLLYTIEETVLYQAQGMSSYRISRPSGSGLSEQDQNLSHTASAAHTMPSPAKRRQSTSRQSSTTLSERSSDSSTNTMPASASFQLAVGNTDELSPRRKARRSMVCRWCSA